MLCLSSMKAMDKPSALQAAQWPYLETALQVAHNKAAELNQPYLTYFNQLCKSDKMITDLKMTSNWLHLNRSRWTASAL